MKKIFSRRDVCPVCGADQSESIYKKELTSPLIKHYYSVIPRKTEIQLSDLNQESSAKRYPADFVASKGGPMNHS